MTPVYNNLYLYLHLSVCITHLSITQHHNNPFVFKVQLTHIGVTNKVTGI